VAFITVDTNNYLLIIISIQLNQENKINYQTFLNDTPKNNKIK
jgi:hypothetical protein